MSMLSGDAGAGFLILAVAFFLYWLPSILAWGRDNFASIAVINGFLGWTVVGWVVALAMAVGPRTQKAPPTL